MDPLTICMTVTGLIKSCSTAVTTCNGLLGKYKNAPDILASIRTECKTIKTALSYVDWSVKRDTELLSSQLHAHTPLAETFDVALTGCALTFTLLDIELQKLYERGKDQNGYNWKDKMRYVWDEDRVKTILDHMRGLQSAVNLMLTALQTSSISAIVPLLQNQRPVIERVRQDTRSIRESCSLKFEYTADTDRQASLRDYSVLNSSIGEEEFAFDDEIINSIAYRNAIKRLASKAKANQQNLKPGEHCILDEPLIDLEEPSQTSDEPKIKFTAIIDHESLTPTKYSTQTALLSNTVMGDLKSLLPTSIGPPSPQINERHAGSTSPSYDSGSSSDASADQRDKKGDVGKVIWQPVRDDVYHETRNVHQLSRKSVRASDNRFKHFNQSTNITSDAVEDVHQGEKRREGALARLSAATSPIDYFDVAKELNERSRPRVRRKTIQPDARNIKVRNETKDTKVKNTKYHIPSSLRQRFSGSHTNREGQVTTSADDENVGKYTAAAKDSGSNYHNPPVEIEVIHDHEDRGLSDADKAREEGYTHADLFRISSVPPDSVPDGEAEIMMPNLAARSMSKDADAANRRRKKSTPKRSRNLSRERTALNDKIFAEKEASSRKDKERDKPHRRNEKLSEYSRSKRHSSSKEPKEEDVSVGAGSSLVPPNEPSRRLQYDDQYSVPSGTSKSSHNSDPKFLENAEKAIRRLIIPELEALKQEQGVQKSRVNVDRYRKVSRKSGRNGLPTVQVDGRSRYKTASSISRKPEISLNRAELNADIELSGDPIKSREESRGGRSLDLPSVRELEREPELALSEETVIAEKRYTHRKRSQKQRLRDDASGALSGGLLTAEASKHHERKHDTFLTSIDRERRTSNENQNRVADTADSAEVFFRKHDVPPMPMRSEVYGSDITRDSILTEQSDEKYMPNRKVLDVFRRVTPIEMSTRTRQDAQTAELCNDDSNLNQTDLTEASLPSNRSLPS